MNGVIEVEALGAKHKLRFGMVAIEEFESRSADNPKGSTKKVIVDLVYSGLYGEAMRSELPAPEYSLATDICDELAGNTKVLDSIWICFEKSNSGADYLKVLEEKMKQLESVKKKIEKANQNLQKAKEM